MFFSSTSSIYGSQFESNAPFLVYRRTVTYPAGHTEQRQTTTFLVKQIVILEGVDDRYQVLVLTTNEQQYNQSVFYCNKKCDIRTCKQDRSNLPFGVLLDWNYCACLNS